MLGYKIPRADVTYYSKQASQLISVSTAVSLYRWIPDSGFLKVKCPSQLLRLCCWLASKKEAESPPTYPDNGKMAHCPTA